MNSSTLIDVPGAEDDEIDLAKLAAQLWSGKVWIILSTLLSVSLGAAYLALTPATYQSDSLLQLEEKSGALDLSAGLSSLTGDSTPKSAAEIEIIGSRMVLGQAVADLNLDWQASPRRAPVIGYALTRYALPIPEFEWLRPFARTDAKIRLDLLETPPEWVGQGIDLVATGDAGYVVTLPDGQRVEGRVGETLRVRDRGFALRIGELGGRAGRSFVVRQRSEAATIDALRNSLTILEKGRNTGIIEMRFTDRDPQRAQQILGVVAQSYQRQNIARSAAEAESSLSFIKSQLPEAERNVTQAEAALNQYRKSQQSVDLELETQSLLTQIMRLDNQIVALKLQEDEIAQRYTRNHPVYKSLLNNRASLEERLSSLREEVDALPETQRQIITLTRTLEVAQTVFVELLNRQQGLQVLSASNIGNVRIIDSARVAPSPVAPRRILILALSLVLGGAIGAGFVLVRQWMRRGVQSAEELEQLGLSVFATINLAPGSRQGHKSKGPLPIHALSHPDDLVTEAFRSLRTSLHFGMLDAKTRSIAFTSAAPAAGKSFTAVNLAAVAAQSNQKVCLMDADLRRGYLRRYFDLEKGMPGLAEIIAGEADLDEVLVEGPVAGLMFLPTGRYPPNPSELLMRKEFPALIKALDDRFDLTICDAPPVLAVTDPVVIGRSVGATIAVVRHDQTHSAEVEALKRSLEAGGVRLTGAVLNGFDPRKAKSQGQYGYTYRYTYERRQD